MEQECRKYGSVEMVWVDTYSTRGDVYVRFLAITSAANCWRALSGRWFDGNQIAAEVIPL